ncbi:uncharacterized protein LOC126773697 [Nymphalis io]|uniref:uncharacterized protein LOC126773697 n=1 Tax=Inachis io TaxID=171585 RepID=UPI00216A348B|nr:uncharacterized protein LOC126773697 [Nymphalis io]
MDVTAICNDSFKEKRTFQEILPISYKSVIPDIALVRERSNLQSDVLMAVKLDPAVLEAQVTINNGENVGYERNYTDTVQKLKKKDESLHRKHHSDFEKAMCLQRAALFSLSSNQFSLLMKYADTLRQQRVSLQKYLECGFCKNNGEPEVWYTTHALKDGKGRVRCPILRALSCRRCGGTGDNAHTIKYCPQRLR